MNISLNTKKYLIVVAYILSGMIGGYILFVATHGSKKYVEREKLAAVALAKVEVEREHIAARLAITNRQLDSAKKALAEKPKQIVKIKIRYVEKRDSIRVLPFNERLELFAKRVASGGAR